MKTSRMQLRLVTHPVKVRPFLSQCHSLRLGNFAPQGALPNYGRRAVSESSKEGSNTRARVIQGREHKPSIEVSEYKLKPKGRLLREFDSYLESTRPHHLTPERIAEMKAERAARSYVQPEAPWGFVVYRAVYGKESDEPWERMLDALWPRPSHWPKEPWELDRPFQLTVMEDEERLSGADSHTIRKEFREWVAHDLPPRVQYPEQEGGVDSIKARIRRKTVHDVHQSEPGNIYHPWYSAPARWSFCLFVDDTCLRSLNHKRGFEAIIGAVVKIVNLRYNRGRCENIAEGWEDGETDDLLEDVGWMYMPAHRHEDCYETLSEDPTDWDGEPLYMRPVKEGNPDACGLLYSGFSSFCPGSDGGNMDPPEKRELQ